VPNLCADIIWRHFVAYMTTMILILRLLCHHQGI
jgi:hypothetical protein